MTLEVRTQPVGLCLQTCVSFGRQQERQRRRHCLRTRGLGHLWDKSSFLDDDMGIGAADAEGRDSCAAWMPEFAPWQVVGEEADGSRRPVDLRCRVGGAERLRKESVL